MRALHRQSSWVDATSSVEDFVQDCALEAIKQLLPPTSSIDNLLVIDQFVASLELGQQPDLHKPGMPYLMVRAMVDPNVRSALELRLADKFYSHLRPVEPRRIVMP